MSDTYTKLAQAVKSLQRAGKLPVEPTDEQRADWAYGNAATSNPDVTYEMAVKAVEGAKTDLEAYEAIEALAETETVTCEEHGQSWALHTNDYCTKCAEAEGWFWPYWVEGAEVTLFNKPGTVRWVLPEGKGVAVVFEDGQMFWAYAEHIGEIQER